MVRLFKQMALGTSANAKSMPELLQFTIQAKCQEFDYVRKRMQTSMRKSSLKTQCSAVLHPYFNWTTIGMNEILKTCE